MNKIHSCFCLLVTMIHTYFYPLNRVPCPSNLPYCSISPLSYTFCSRGHEAMMQHLCFWTPWLSAFKTHIWNLILTHDHGNGDPQVYEFTSDLSHNLYKYLHDQTTFLCLHLLFYCFLTDLGGVRMMCNFDCWLLHGYSHGPNSFERPDIIHWSSSLPVVLAIR